ncbi:hypothetical protein HDK64DRAFT_272972 [Phyllosticta capitalensis]
MTTGPHARMPSASANHPDAPIPHNTRNAALVGASTAFAKPPVKPKPANKTYSGNNGALAAARQTATPQPPLQPQGTGNSTASHASRASFSLKAGAAAYLGVPVVSGDRARSPSIVAATRAAALHTPVADASADKRKSWNNTSNESLPATGNIGDLRSRFDGSRASLSSFRVPSKSPPKQARNSRSPSPQTISQPQQSTTSLVERFEHRNVDTTSSSKPPVPRNPKPKPKPILTSQGPPPPIKSPKPQRNFTSPIAYASLQDNVSADASPIPRAASAGQARPPSAKSKPPPKPAPKPAKFSGEYRRASIISSPPQVPPKPTSIASPREPSAEVASDSDEDAQYESAPESKEEIKAKPVLPPPRRSNITKPAGRAQSLDGSKETAPLERRPTLVRSGNVTPLSSANIRLQPTSSTYKRESAKMLEPHFTGDSLANAIVGASLATSRTSTPVTVPPPPAPRRHGKHHHVKSRSRNPSPQKRPGHLLHTLRKEPSSSDVDSDSGRDMKHKKKRHFRPKHPNKHKEGSRKRWRERVTERERKRYDGVWAANRGEFLPREYSEFVHGYVVKDIWSRSRLPPHVLEVIWDLVDHSCVGMLSREEFVVGMWVIDQALKGRKVPVKIQESVWESVRGLGVKVRKLRSGGGSRR